MTRSILNISGVKILTSRDKKEIQGGSHPWDFCPEEWRAISCNGEFECRNPTVPTLVCTDP